MKSIKVSEKEAFAIIYAREFLNNAYIAHKSDSLGKAIRPELIALGKVCKKIKA